ncbi:phosphatidylserine decarboxylase-domain-containing protein [Chytridium lagenaria]|nr:phosphatidylserine decarboxylase-domain-containing protein [Chytridium lagenaria]
MALEGTKASVIYVQDRTSKQIYEEQLPVYVRIGERCESIKMLLRSLTMKQGAKYTDPSSREEIGRFIAFHNIVMDEIQQPLSAFANFNEFFYRKLKPGTRVPESKDANVILSPVDSRMCCYPTLSDVTRFWVKGTKFDLPRLLSDEKMASLFSNGALSIFRLAPQDYHRFHSPVNGVIKSIKRVSGEFFTVANVAVQSAVDVYTENERVVFLIDTPKTGSGPGSFGIVALICVGSLLVGSINATVKVGQNVKRMDELGYFAFGGSTVILVFAEDTMTFDHDLIDYSSQCLESVVKVGNQIGISLR